MAFMEKLKKQRVDLQWSDHSYYNIGFKTNKSLDKSLQAAKQDFGKSDHCYHTFCGETKQSSLNKNPGKHKNETSELENYNIPQTSRISKDEDKKDIVSQEPCDWAFSVEVGNVEISDTKENIESHDNIPIESSCVEISEDMGRCRSYEIISSNKQQLHIFCDQPLSVPKEKLSDLSNSPELLSPICVSPKSPIQTENCDIISHTKETLEISGATSDHQADEIPLTCSKGNKKRTDHSYCDSGNKKARKDESDNQFRKCDHTYIKRTRAMSCDFPSIDTKRTVSSVKKSESTADCLHNIDVKDECCTSNSINTILGSGINIHLSKDLKKTSSSANVGNFARVSTGQISVQDSTINTNINKDTNVSECMLGTKPRLLSLFEKQNALNSSLGSQDNMVATTIPINTQDIGNINLQSLSTSSISVTPFRIPVGILAPVPSLLLQPSYLSQPCFQSAPSLLQVETSFAINVGETVLPMSNNVPGVPMSILNLPTAGDIFTTAATLSPRTLDNNEQFYTLEESSFQTCASSKSPNQSNELSHVKNDSNSNISSFGDYNATFSDNRVVKSIGSNVEITSNQNEKRSNDKCSKERINSCEFTNQSQTCEISMDTKTLAISEQSQCKHNKFTTEQDSQQFIDQNDIVVETMVTIGSDETEICDKNSDLSLITAGLATSQINPPDSDCIIDDSVKVSEKKSVKKTPKKHKNSHSDRGVKMFQSDSIKVTKSNHKFNNSASNVLNRKLLQAVITDHTYEEDRVNGQQVSIKRDHSYIVNQDKKKSLLCANKNKEISGKIINKLTAKKSLDIYNIDHNYEPTL